MNRFDWLDLIKYLCALAVVVCGTVLTALTGTGAYFYSALGVGGMLLAILMRYSD